MLPKFFVGGRAHAAQLATLQRGFQQVGGIHRPPGGRAAGRPTVPSLLALEMQTNPFLRADDPALKTAVGMPEATAEQVFAEIRARKDKF